MSSLVWVLTAVLSFISFHFVGQWMLSRKRVAWILARRVLGFVLLGGVPAGVAYASRVEWMFVTGLVFRISGVEALSTLVAVAAVVFAMRSFAKRPELWEENPEIRVLHWPRLLWVMNSVSWVLYLAGYEYLFRGFLQLGLRGALGEPLALLVSVALYLAAHIFRPREEILGALAMAPVFAAGAAVFQSVLSPVLIHISIALSMDYFSQKNRFKEGELGRESNRRYFAVEA